MAQKTAIVDKLVTSVSKMYVPKGFIAEMILTPLRVIQTSGLIGKYGQDHLRIVNTIMGGRGKAPRYESITRSSDTYLIQKHGLEGMITEEEFENVESPFEARRDESLGLSTVIALGREKALADSLGDTGILTNNVTLAGTDQWSDYANSDPIEDIKNAQTALFDKCGHEADTVVMSWSVSQNLKYHPQVIASLGFQYNRKGTLTEQEMAHIFGVRRVLVGRVQYNSAKKGQPNVRANVWGKDVILAVSPTSPQKYQTALGYTIRRKKDSRNQTFKFPIMNPPNAEGLIVQDNYDDVLQDIDCAYLIKNAIA